MKHRMTIEIDDESRTATVIGCSEGIVLQHSGSSYYRIKIKDNPEQIGTISGHHDWTCYPNKFKKDVEEIPMCGLNHLQIQIRKKAR